MECVGRWLERELKYEVKMGERPEKKAGSLNGATFLASYKYKA